MGTRERKERGDEEISLEIRAYCDLVQQIPRLVHLKAGQIHEGRKQEFTVSERVLYTCNLL